MQGKEDFLDIQYVGKYKFKLKKSQRITVFNYSFSVLLQRSDPDLFFYLVNWIRVLIQDDMNPEHRSSIQ